MMRFRSAQSYFESPISKTFKGPISTVPLPIFCIDIPSLSRPKNRAAYLAIEGNSLVKSCLCSRMLNRVSQRSLCSFFDAIIW